MTRVTRAGTPPHTVTLHGELTVSRLGLGTIRLTEERGFGPARANAVQLLRRAVELGVNFIDTADSYGPGTAETVVCEALHPYERHHDRDQGRLRTPDRRRMDAEWPA